MTKAMLTASVTTTEEKLTATQTLIEHEISKLSSRPDDIAITCSFQIEGMIVLDIIRQTLPGVPVIFLDTGYHFAEVYDYRDQMTRDWSLNLINLLPELTVAEQESQFGILHQIDHTRCCAMRKVKPLFRAMENYKLWFTGMRREQAKSREAMQITTSFKLPSGKHIRKICPLAEWTSKDVWTVARQRNIPLLSLYDQGYSSIGCEPCTHLPLDPNDPRSGRWGGQKQECGIHIQAS